MSVESGTAPVKLSSTPNLKLFWICFGISIVVIAVVVAVVVIAIFVPMKPVCNERNDINECVTGTHTCDANAECSNVVGRYKCVCKPGFTGNGSSCVDINECVRGTHKCDANAECSNAIGSYNCVCKPGFTGNGSSCVDINECELGTHSCDTNATCTNEVGSYICTCDYGFRGNGSSCRRTQCPENWDRHKESCYWFSNFTTQWFIALHYCQALEPSGYLTEITDADENQFLLDTGGNHFFSHGGIRILEVWKWSKSQTLLNYTNWAPRNPSGSGTVEPCGHFYTPPGTWNDYNCVDLYRFICEVDAW